MTEDGEPNINVSSELEGDKDYTITYKEKAKNIVSDFSKPGVYEVWVIFPDGGNCRHPDGSTEKQVGSFIAANGTATLYTVTFNGNEKAIGAMDNLKLAGDRIVMLPECG